MVIDLNEFNKLDRIHPYPAKYTLDFALDIISKYSNEGDVIYDPFLGSGTTSLAAKITRRNSIGTDINPIAILISKFKTQSIQSENFKILERFITNIEKDIRVDEYEIINYEGIDHWFKQEVKIALSEILYNIERAFSGNEECLIFCKEVFSNILNQVSNQESDTRYAAVNKPEMTYEKVFEIYIKRFRFTLNLLEKCKLNNYQEHYSKILLQDSKKTSETFGEKIVDLIVTSPPYPNTYDYYLYHKHRMLWLGYDFKIAMNSEIGSRREFSSLKNQ